MMGCELAKRGFGEAKVSTFVANAFNQTLAGGFFSDDLAQRPTVGEGFGAQYCVNLCTDVPMALGYLYRRTTLEKWLSPDAAALFKLGYGKPFLFADGKFKAPEGWDEKRMKRAVGNLDYRLGLIEYASEQHRAGAELGAKVCGEYKKKMKPANLGKDASVLYEMGYFNAHLEFSDLKRRPPFWSDDRLRAAYGQILAEHKDQAFGFSDDTASLMIP
jgi:hypothetical protein